jgi:hypothetical protein
VGSVKTISNSLPPAKKREMQKSANFQSTFSFLGFNSTFVKRIFPISSVQSFLLLNNQHNLKSHSKRLRPNLLFIVIIIYPDSRRSDEDCFCAIPTFQHLVLNFVPYLQLLKAEASNHLSSQQGQISVDYS